MYIINFETINQSCIDKFIEEVCPSEYEMVTQEDGYKRITAVFLKKDISDEMLKDKLNKLRSILKADGFYAEYGIDTVLTNFIDRYDELHNMLEEINKI
jgi:hypothetical protein